MVKSRNHVKPSELEPVERVCHFIQKAEQLARKARKAKKSLTGNNTYADGFHKNKIGATQSYKELKAAVAPIADSALERTLGDIEAMLSHFWLPATSRKDRGDLRREIEMLVRTEVQSALRAVSGQEAEFLPMDIVDSTRGYVVKVAQQVNRCFQHDCLDACGVMTRRLLETLIIEVFEKKGIADKIKDANGNYLMFADLVSKLMNTPETPVGRTTHRELPGIAIVLNNCAHSRTFNIGRGQLMRYHAFIVIAVQELVGLWDIRRT